MDTSILADIAAVGTLLVAVASVVYVRREWLHKTGHWLYIPAPAMDQDPVRPDFWVFPPVRVDDDYVVVIAGKIINAGPSDAFSIHVYAELEFSEPKQVRDQVLEAAINVVAHHHPQATRDELWDSFTEAYRTRDSYVPVLRVGEDLRFVVVAKCDSGSRYLNSLPEGAGRDSSCAWTFENRQAHAVHVSSHTIIGRKRLFGPSELCAPFEPQPAI